jgi:ketosteroid isomerase-like protein
MTADDVVRSVQPDSGANRELVERFFAASEEGDRAALVSMIDEHMVMAWPQSGEVFRGRDNVMGAMAAVEVKPEFAGEPQLVGSGDVWVLMVPLRYGESIEHYVAILELADGRIQRGTGYWGSAFPAQEARSAFVDRT